MDFHDIIPSRTFFQTNRKTSAKHRHILEVVLRNRLTLNFNVFRQGAKYPFFPSESAVKPLAPWETQSFMLFFQEKMIAHTADVPEKIGALNMACTRTKAIEILFERTSRPSLTPKECLDFFETANKNEQGVPQFIGIGIFPITEKVVFVSFSYSDQKFSLTPREKHKVAAIDSIKLWLEECDMETATTEFITRLPAVFKESAEIKRPSRQWIGSRLVSLDRIYAFDAEPFVEERHKPHILRPEEIHEVSARSTSETLIRSLATDGEPPRSLAHMLKIDINLIVAGVFYLGHMTIGYSPVKYIGMKNVRRWIRESSYKIMMSEFVSDKFNITRHWDNEAKAFKLSGLTEVAGHVTSGNPLDMTVVPIWDFSLYENIIRDRIRISDVLFYDSARDLCVVLLRNCGVEKATTTFFADIVMEIPSASPPQTIKDFLAEK